jgi:hypothetical protein
MLATHIFTHNSENFFLYAPAGISRAANYGCIALVLNRLESLCTVRSGGRDREGVGGLNPWGLGVRYRTGSHAQIFYSARRFELFSRNQRIQTAARSLPQGKSSICKQLRSTACSVRAPWWRFSANYFPGHLEVPRGAGRISGALRPGTAWPHRRYCREIQKTFFVRTQRRLGTESVERAENCREIQGWGGRSGADMTRGMR